MRRLSSNWTWVYKVFFPMLWVAVPGYLLLVPFLDGTYDQGNWVVLVIVVMAAALFLHKSISIKFVTLSGDELLVTGYVKTIRIPLKDVERVWIDGNRWSRDIPLIRFETRVPTPFGSRIAFMPIYYFGSKESPVFEELTDLVLKATGSMPR